METREYDVVIVGSGAGGGTVAAGLAELAEAGARVAVLEWGPRLRDDEYTGREVEMARRLYVDSGGMLTKDRSITLAMGCAYGGSTVVYTGVTLPIPERVVSEWGVPDLDWADLDRRSRRLSDLVNVHALPDEQINDNNRAFARGCRELGWSLKQIQLNVRGCRGAGLCNLGCPNRAKMGTHRVQLPEAERAGVEVVTDCRVLNVSKGEVLAVVSGHDFGQPSPWRDGDYRVKAKVVVLAGNAVQTSALLLRSGFRDRLPALGRWLTLHPALILTAEHDRRLTNFWGHPKSYYTDEFHATDRFLLEVCMYFPFVTAKNLTGFGRDHAEAMAAYPQMQQILALAMDRAEEENRVEIDRRGEPVVRYRLAEDTLSSLHTAMLRATELFFAGGARRVHAPAGARFWIEEDQRGALEEAIPRTGMVPGRLSISSAHLMGGCRMGRDSAESVANAWGEVHGEDWLFAADSSLFPGCSEVNPYLTVMALADRVAERILWRQKELL